MELLFPSRCVFCGAVCQESCCSVCQKKLPWIKDARCFRCGKPLRYQEAEFCQDCKYESQFYFEQGRSLWLHIPPVDWSLYQFKYHNRKVWGGYYAKGLFREFGKELDDWRIQLIVPIPLHKNRYRKRGYNQAEVLATQIGFLSGIEVIEDALIRCRNTVPQKGLSSEERRRNTKSAFSVKRITPISGKVILLVDDIYTTGSTMNAAAKVLKESGAVKVYFFTISIGQGF